MGLWQLYDAKDPFYLTCPHPIDGIPRLGQICWAPTIFHNDPLVLNLKRAEPTSHTEFSGTIRRPHSGLFRAKGELPLAHLTLAPTEELIGYKTKKRPAIIVGPSSDNFDMVPIDTHRVNQNYGFFVVPIYSVTTPFKRTLLSPEDLRAARKMENLSFFPCPPLSGVLEGSGIARLDKFGVCYQYNGWIDWTDWALNPSLVNTLLSMLRKLFASNQEHALSELIEVLQGVEPE